MITLKITNRDSGESSTLSSDKDTLSIGRIPGCDVLLDSSSVSRRHAEITRIRGHYHIMDLESGNGTFYKGVRLNPNEKQILANDDSIRIENFEIIPVIETSQNSKEEQTDSGIIEIKMIKKVLSALDCEKSPSLEVLSEPAKGKKIFFTDSIPELVIGRDENCDLSIDTGVISRRHAVIQKKWGGIAITDLKSKNGTFVNGTRIAEKEVHDGDKITLGDIELVFRNPHEIDLDALTKEYESKEVEQAPPPPHPDDVATGFIDAQTGEDMKQKLGQEIDSESISEQAKMSVDNEELEQNKDNSNPDTSEEDDILQSLTEDEPQPQALEQKSNRWNKQKLEQKIKQILKIIQDYGKIIFSFVKNQLKHFSLMEIILLSVIVLILLLSFIAFLIIFIP